MDQITFWLNISTNYISFGLALYAIGAVIALVWTHKRNGGHISENATVDVLRAGACVVALVLLEVVRQFWDSLHAGHLPLWLTRALLPGLYFALGNSIFRLNKAEASQEGPPIVTKEAGRSAT